MLPRRRNVSHTYTRPLCYWSLCVDINTNEAPPVKHMGWPSACSPTSPLRRTSFDPDTPPSPPAEKTFIYDHLKATDPCLHPSLLHHHGQFIAHNQGPTPHSVMVPQFSYSATRLHHDIIPATPINWVEDITRDSDPKFEDKTDDRLLWKGTTTGMWAGEDMRWRNQHRMRLVRLANQLNGTIDVLRSTSPTERVGETVQMSMARVNPAMLDVTFTGEPHSCSEGICEVVRDEYEFRKHQSVETSGSYKYILDVRELQLVFPLFLTITLTWNRSTETAGLRGSNASWSPTRSFSNQLYSGNGSKNAYNRGSITSPSKSIYRICTIRWRFSGVGA